MARSFNHPTVKQIVLDGVLHALSDPIRRQIVRRLMASEGMGCNQTCDVLSPSTLSFHIRVLREAGLIFSEKKGVQVINTLRADDVNQKYPGLLAGILASGE